MHDKLHLADELFFLHLDEHFRPVVQRSIASLGFGAAILGELAATTHLTIADGLVVVRYQSAPPDNALGHDLLERVRSEDRAQPVRDWLAYFVFEDVYDRVAERMTVAGLLHRQKRRRLLGRQTVYQPVEPATAWLPMARLRHDLADPARPISGRTAFLLSAARSLGLQGRLTEGAPGDVTKRLDSAVRALPSPIRQLLRHLDAAVGATTMSHRT
jgi:hypothetical protein